MRNLTLLFLLISSQGFSQKPIAALEIEEATTLYRGYDNIVIPAVTNNKKSNVSLKGSNATISKQENSNRYIVRPGESKTARLFIVLEKNNKIDTIRTIDYRVLNLPNPSLFWGAAPDNFTANIREQRLFLKYPPEIPFNATFTIESWELIHKNDTIRGDRNTISSAEVFLKTITEETRIQINVVGLGPDKLKRNISGSWTVHPWESEINQSRKMMIECGG